MNVSTSDLSSSLSALLASQGQSTTQTQSNLAAALLNTDSTTSTDPTSASDLSSLFDSSSSNSQLLASGVQNAASFIQASQSSLSSISSVLGQMASLASDASNSTTSQTQVAQDQKSFDALRDQLRADIGGSTSEMGGAADVAGSASLNGTPLFGSNATSFTIGTGLTSAPTMNVNGVNLQQGPMSSLLSQDSSGAYTLNLSDSGAATAIAQAQQQVQAGATTLNNSDSVLSATLATLQIQSSNMVSALDSVSDDSQLAQYNILGQSSSALSSQANLDPSDVMSLLQGA